jgi:hypothetical protein
VIKITNIPTHPSNNNNTTTTMASLALRNRAALDSMWASLGSLSATSPPSAFTQCAAYFTPDAKAYLLGMEAPPSVGREAIVQTYQSLVTYWGIVERKVIFSAEGKTENDNASGSVIVNTMVNKLKIAGKDLEGVNECEVVVFEGGLIKEYQLFVDPSPIMKILTGSS